MCSTSPSLHTVSHTIWLSLRLLAVTVPLWLLAWCFVYMQWLLNVLCNYWLYLLIYQWLHQNVTVCTDSVLCTSTSHYMNRTSAVCIKPLLCALTLYCIHSTSAVCIISVLCALNLWCMYQTSDVFTDSTLYSSNLWCMHCISAVCIKPYCICYACAVCTVTKSLYCHNNACTLSILLLLIQTVSYVHPSECVCALSAVSLHNHVVNLTVTNTNTIPSS